jgi:hypothetical protein
MMTKTLEYPIPPVAALETRRPALGSPLHVVTSGRASTLKYVTNETGYP